jgi:hypothetical protein
MTFQAIYDWFYNLVNSNFSSALFGAGFGAWSASWIAIRSERQKRLRDEIALCNSAIGLTAGILEVSLNMRSQFLLSMAQSYRERFEEFVAATLQPPPPNGVNIVHFRADLRIVNVPALPTAELKGMLESSASSSAYACSVVGSLARSAEALCTFVRMRSDVISHFPNLGHEEKADVYFGLRMPGGHIDDRYPDAMLGMIDCSQDVAYFSELLIEILMEHGEVLAKAYGRRPPRRTKIDLSEAREAGRLADRSKYPSFERQFRSSSGDMRSKRI